MAELELFHGGALEQAMVRYGPQAEGWIDLSTGLNPWPWPVERAGTLSDMGLTSLPETAARCRLEVAAAACYGISPKACVVAAPGAQALIQCLPYLDLPGENLAEVAVVAPTYEEHAACWRRAGHKVCEVNSPEEADSYDVIIVVNPNNPDGRLFEPQYLLSLADRQADRGGMLVVDEAFADGDTALSCASGAGQPGLCVLRSFGKFFGLGGLRLGFALTHKGLAESLRGILGPWAVSGPAVAIGCRALADKRWIEETNRRLCRESDKLAAALRRMGFHCVGATRFFQLINVDNGGQNGGQTAKDLHEHLAHRGILTRRFEHWPHWLRIGLLPHAPGLERLVKALEAWHQ
ncbi:MAG: threonine-phosphate decarboxylase CobD [Parvularculales bacterium]